MELEAAKAIGAGLAVIALAGTSMGVGNVFSSFISSVARNPAARDDVQAMTFLGFALVEALGLFALIIALLILFVL